RSDRAASPSSSAWRRWPRGRRSRPTRWRSRRRGSGAPSTARSARPWTFLSSSSSTSTAVSSWISLSAGPTRSRRSTRASSYCGRGKSRAASSSSTNDPEREDTVKHGFRVLDSDLHTMEPDALWERYLDPRFRAFAPTFVRRAENAPNQPITRIGDLEIGERPKRPRTAAVGQDLHRRAFARHPHYAVAHARGYDPESHLTAMDIEGIDVA